MQATGMVNDHLRDCFRWREVRRPQRAYDSRTTTVNGND